MTSRGEQAIDSLMARLRIPEDLEGLSEELQALAAALDGLTVNEFPLRPDDGLHVHVFPADEKPTPMGTRLVSRELLVKLELSCPIADAEATPANKAIDPLYLWCVARLLSDRTLGDLVDWVEEKGRTWRAREAERAHAMMLVDLSVKYRTLASNPERRA